ncbi:ribonuclease Z, partial [Candidatus Woesearchaeota archaeon]|nr:ribonuclease Z [Candidatus Woesearchaeota archaeon]
TYIPELERHNAGYLVKINNQNLVFDFGRGVLDGLLREGVHYYDIDYIFITHMHADHCSELSSLLHIALVELPVYKFRKKDLVIYGPKGFKDSFKHILDAFDLAKHKPEYKIEVKELKDGSIVKGKDWIMKSFVVKHSENRMCLAYRLESNNKVLAYSGDSGDCPGLKKTIENADLAILEATVSKALEKELEEKLGDTKIHLTEERAAKLATETKVKTLVLTHIPSFCLKKFNIKENAKKFFKGKLVIAKDMMKFKI